VRENSQVFYSHILLLSATHKLCNAIPLSRRRRQSPTRLSLIYIIFFGENAQIPERWGRIQTNKLTNAAPAGRQFNCSDSECAAKRARGAAAVLIAQMQK
jgi:hypothetical protein